MTQVGPQISNNVFQLNMNAHTSNTDTRTLSP